MIDYLIYGTGIIAIILVLWAAIIKLWLYLLVHKFGFYIIHTCVSLMKHRNKLDTVFDYLADGHYDTDAYAKYPTCHLARRLYTAQQIFECSSQLLRSATDEAKRYKDIGVIIPEELFEYDPTKKFNK